MKGGREKKKKKQAMKLYSTLKVQIPIIRRCLRRDMALAVSRNRVQVVLVITLGAGRSPGQLIEPLALVTFTTGKLLSVLLLPHNFHHLLSLRLGRGGALWELRGRKKKKKSHQHNTDMEREEKACKPHLL